MLPVINFVAVVVVSAVVIFQYIVYSHSTKQINARIQESAVQNKANLEILKKESNTTLKQTKEQVTKDLQANAQSTKGAVDATRAQVTQQVTNVTSSMDNYFKTMSQSITTKALTTDSATTKSIKSGKLHLGDKFVMSGVGDAHANDEWLRLFGKDEKNYYGGLAVGKVWAKDSAELHGSVLHSGHTTMKGGESEHNQGNGSTHFPFTDGKNYIRGDTEIRGNTDNIGRLNIIGGKSEHNQGNWGTHFPYADGKNYIRGDTEIRGNTDNVGRLNIIGGKSEHNQGNGSTHFPFTDGKNYIRGDTEIRGNTDNIGRLNIIGGKSEHNQGNWGTHFPYADGKNYIRGDTEIRGNTNNIGDMTVNRNLCVQDVCINKDDMLKLKQKLVA